jgi:hypothetical protein
MQAHLQFHRMLLFDWKVLLLSSSMYPQNYEYETKYPEHAFLTRFDKQKIKE